MNFSYLLILLFSAVVFVWLCRKLKMPPIIGYLLVGILIGEGGIGWLSDIDRLHDLAEFGIVFLMFTLGLDFSIPRLLSSKKMLLGIGGLQVSICTLAGFLICSWFKLAFKQAFIISGALSLSSTAIVVKLLIDQKEQKSSYSQVAINILLFQDLAAVIFLILIPALSTKSIEPLYYTFIVTVIKGIAVTIGMTIAGLWLLRPLFREIAKTHSNELFMIASLFVVLSSAGLTNSIGLSTALGAFMAGLMLGETEFKHQIELDIRPFRDVLLGLFFVIIGTYLQLKLLPTIWSKVCILALLLMSLKFIVIFLITKIFTKETLKNSFRVGLILANGGEFSFVLLREAVDMKLLSTRWESIIFSGVVISALLAPIIIIYSKKITNLLWPNKDLVFDLPDLIEHSSEINNHVILCGFGRVGQILSRFIEQEQIPWLALDLDPMRISKTSIAGEHSFYGDATHPDILAAAGLAKARMIVISFHNEPNALEVLKHVRAMRLDVPVFVRTQHDTNLEAFQRAGATEVIPETLEGSIMLAAHLLLALGIPTARVVAKIRKIQISRYENLKGFYKGIDEYENLDEEEPSRSLYSLVVTTSALSIGKPLQYLLENFSNVKIKALIRNEERYLNPDQNITIEANDVLVVLALPEEAVKLEEKIFVSSGE